MQMSSGRCGVQAWETTRLGWDGLTLTPTSGLESPGPWYPLPITSHTQQAASGRVLLYLELARTPLLAAPHPPGAWREPRVGEGRTTGIRGPEEAPSSPSSNQGGSRPALPCRLALLSARTVWVGCSGLGPSPLSPTQLRLLELQEAPLYRASWMAWKWRPHDGQN